MQQPISQIVVIGGGSAGWITAGLLAAEHNVDKGQISPSPKLDICVIESPDVATIGVGEGTWPSMRSTLQKIGISETQFMLCCDASFKQGSEFINWHQSPAENTEQSSNIANRYYHPFSLPTTQAEFPIAQYWLPFANQVSFTEAVTSHFHVSQLHLAPKQISTAEYGFINNYGYHLNAAKFGQLLQQHCTEKLGVRYIQDHVEAVQLVTESTQHLNGCSINDNAELGDIHAITTRNHGDVHAQFFIDCTGTKALLLGEALKVPFVSHKQVLFNDCALALQVPYASEQTDIASNTRSTATDNGWIWDIGLPSRRGIGHVYSSAHQSDEQALEQLIGYIEPQLGSKASDISPRKLNIEPGHRQVCWHKNCVAIGMASGFIEPLEASALALIEWLAGAVATQLPANRSIMNTVAKRINTQFEQHWQQIIEFLKLHYVLSERQSDYWQDHRAEATAYAPLAEKLQLWQHHVPSQHDILHKNALFPAQSYQFILFGMGAITQASSQLKPSLKQQAQQIFTENANRSQQLVKALPSNRSLLAQLRQHGFPLI
ncbi:tryptophan 7-halogenase [Shewanella maritima]|uniref:tryptophan 7-halogenase n=1 Tax=Shewanella maritima TaxID=2520507 RepID=UPI00373654D0